MEMLMRETLTLYKVLSKYLPQQAVEVRDSFYAEHCNERLISCTTAADGHGPSLRSNQPSTR